MVSLGIGTPPKKILDHISSTLDGALMGVGSLWPIIRIIVSQ
jgi:hypothetical protein